MVIIAPIAPQPAETGNEDCFGGCPVCHRNDCYLNVDRQHWMVCHTHKTAWYIGSNLFSTWRTQTEETFQKNAELLSEYEVVEPWYPG